MAYYYNVIIQDSVPTTTINGTLWIDRSSSQVYIYIGTWTPIAGGGAVTVSEGNYYLSAANQEAAPTEVVGKIWVKSTAGQAFIFLDTWQPFA